MNVFIRQFKLKGVNTWIIFNTEILNVQEIRFKN